MHHEQEGLILVMQRCFNSEKLTMYSSTSERQRRKSHHNIK